MKMIQHAEKKGGSGCRTVMVGVKLDSESRELLTWAMVKVAQPGDTVIALHVLGNNEIVDREGKSSLLSLVKAFDSVLAVYEGFCNLKQVDLKLKICRGSSIRKILVREAKSYSATNIIVGAARTHHTIRSPTSVAKYCAKKLSKDCLVLAVHNGKVVFQKEGSTAKTGDSHGSEDDQRKGFVNIFHRSISLSKNSKVISESGINEAPKYVVGEGNEQTFHQALVKARPNSLGSIMKQNCTVCGAVGNSLDESCNQSAEKSSGDNGGDNKSLALVPVSKVEGRSSSFRSLIAQVPELKPGWPLLRRAILPGGQASDRSSLRQISVVQWAMRLPSRQLSSSISNLDHKQNGEGQPSLDGESGAIVAVGTDALTIPPSPDHNAKLPIELEGFHEKYSATCRLFQYQELLSATSNFLAEYLVGKGGSSQVYKGCLPDGKELAVKILKPSEDVLKEFVLEIEIITTLNHKNIISLLGFCFEYNKLLLVYDFLSRGSLEENLHGNRKDPLAFNWYERYKVAVGVAEALNYLHTGTAQPVIHRDVKSSNILLSDDFEPQLSDFGLAKWASTSSSHIICTDVAGTFGYLAPEYFMYGKVNEKIDVYAFGVVLLELLSGRKPISNDLPKGQESLVMWAKPILDDGKFCQLLDPSLGDDYDQDQMERMVLAATLCVKRSPRARPQMSLVLKLLHGDAEVTKWARLQVNKVEESDMLDDETCPRSNIQSHLNLAFLDVEDDSLSISSIEQTVSLEDYLQGRCSRSSSFD
ncbi:protein kinase STUNTED [Ricinus communis]|uniref:ATP binding protein, putative n=1 Tax=Ricinus communis TaxID=3988 RepID=B9S2T6_RICCO|nr:protein kinase STUNTED [Ricinus communis]EEF42091.1 ATP binding protein, putative [Ricinus communis]|eukprot:XP_002520305.1 probable receptor-like serine/threonine-protein kinase At5g57670 [Ricinus communis]